MVSTIQIRCLPQTNNHLYAATVFAYGQTASGKTFVSNLACRTMFLFTKIACDC